MPIVNNKGRTPFFVECLATKWVVVVIWGIYDSLRRKFKEIWPWKLIRGLRDWREESVGKLGDLWRETTRWNLWSLEKLENVWDFMQSQAWKQLNTKFLKNSGKTLNLTDFFEFEGMGQKQEIF
jgi:hypothetical protein